MYHDITLQEEEQMATKNLYNMYRKEENSHLIIIYTIYKKYFFFNIVTKITNIFICPWPQKEKSEDEANSHWIMIDTKWKK